jgi:hypothetical protein
VGLRKRRLSAAPSALFCRIVGCNTATVAPTRSAAPSDENLPAGDRPRTSALSRGADHAAFRKRDRLPALERYAGSEPSSSPREPCCPPRSQPEFRFSTAIGTQHADFPLCLVIGTRLPSQNGEFSLTGSRGAAASTWDASCAIHRARHRVAQPPERRLVAVAHLPRPELHVTPSTPKGPNSTATGASTLRRAGGFPQSL